jgi:PTS system mannose-specific IIC component
MNPVIAVAIVGGALSVEYRSSLRLMLSQPLCGGLIIGLTLGVPSEGLFAGMLVQMMFLGIVTVRGERKPDLAAAGVTGAALYILSLRALGGYPGLGGIILFIALLFSAGAAALGGLINRAWEHRAWGIYKAALAGVREGRIGRASALHCATLLFHFCSGFLLPAVLVLLGRMLIVHLAPRIHAAAGGSLDFLHVLVPLLGAGTLARFHLGAHRTFWFGAGFLVAYVFVLVRG